MSGYYVECANCDASYQASYDTDAYRWMQTHDGSCDEEPAGNGEQP